MHDQSSVGRDGVLSGRLLRRVRGRAPRWCRAARGLQSGLLHRRQLLPGRPRAARRDRAMRHGFAIFLAVACVVARFGRAAAWDSRCYLPGGAECSSGPATARSRWIGPSDEHRALLEFGRIFGGLPSSTKDDFTLPVFTSDTEIDVVFSGGTPPPPFQSAPPPNAIPVTSLQPVNFIDTKRTQTRRMSFPEFAQLPDHAFSLWDWALGNETCPLGDTPARNNTCAGTPAVVCHEF